MKHFYTTTVTKIASVLLLSAFFFLFGLTTSLAQVTSATVSLSSATPLLLAFSGQIEGSEGQLIWTMENETNTKCFVIERAIDANHFDSIDVVTGLNNAHETDYTYTDAHLLNGNNYYRLREVNMDGAFKYSKVICINNSAFAGKMQVFPNPAISMLTYTINCVAADQVIIQVYNLSGVLETTRQQQLSAGINQQSIAVGSLKSGSYVLRITNLQGTYSYVQTFAKI